MVDLLQRLTVSHQFLKLLAALTWYGGGIALCCKAASLLFEARALQPGNSWLWFTLLGGLFVGAVKGELFFTRGCRKNLMRISELDHPKVWQFFRPVFFLFLAAMILLGATLSRMAHGSYPFLLAVAFIDLSVAVALLWSSRCFWNYQK